jgi:UDP-N-acetylglucosamine diphosphorylase/glucosamine-1-phosphate N-acetyltransferase
MQAVILAGGEGSRLRPLTHNRPKAMIPLANTPIIEHVINALVENGIREITVVVGYRKEAVLRHLNTLDLPIDVVVQEKQLGSAHALRCAEGVMKGDFILLPGDNYIDAASIAKIKDVPNAMLVKEHPYPSNFGVVTIRDGFVTGIVEKPKEYPRCTVSTGVYTLNASFFNHLDGTEIPDAIGEMVASGKKIEAIFAEEWHDAIYPWDLLELNSRIIKKIHPQTRGTVSGSVQILGRVHIGKGTTIGPNSTIHGPVIIGEDCEIGPQTCIMPSTSIGSRVRIDPFTYVENAIIMDDARVGTHSRVTDSVIGEGTLLSDHNTTSTGNYATGESGRLIRGRFGAILGDRASSAPFTVFRHAIIGNNVSIEEGRILENAISDNVVVK